MVYRRTDDEMTAYPHEYDFVRKEGVEFRFLTQPVRVLVGERTSHRLALRAHGTGTRRCLRTAARPRPIAGSEFVIPADQVVKAVGQEKPALAAQARACDRARLHQSERRFRNQPSRRLRRRRLHSRKERRVHRDGGRRTASSPPLQFTGKSSRTR